MNPEPIVVEQTYQTPIGAVWSAITDPEQMRQWYFEPIADFEPTVGFETEFDVEHEGKVFPHLWKISEVIPEKRIAYDWRFGGYPGDSKVSWDLLETPEGTRLVLTHQGWETFPQDDPIFSRDSGVAGWSYFVKESLKGFLEGGT